MVDKTKEKLQEAEPLYPEAPTGKDTNSHTPATISKDDDPASYAEKIRE